MTEFQFLAIPFEATIDNIRELVCRAKLLRQFTVAKILFGERWHIYAGYCDIDQCQMINDNPFHRSFTGAIPFHYYYVSDHTQNDLAIRFIYQSRPSQWDNSPIFKLMVNIQNNFVHFTEILFLWGESLYQFLIICLNDASLFYFWWFFYV